LDNG
jgi:hypothetical protein